MAALSGRSEKRTVYGENVWDVVVRRLASVTLEIGEIQQERQSSVNCEWSVG
jgi:hypothetical protein